MIMHAPPFGDKRLPGKGSKNPLPLHPPPLMDKAPLKKIWTQLPTHGEKEPPVGSFSSGGQGGCAPHEEGE